MYISSTMMKETLTRETEQEMIVRAPHATDAEHLDAVKADMHDMGAPTIMAWHDGEMWWALEGSHRVAAAHALGLTPEIISVTLDTEIDHDFDSNGRKVRDVLAYLSDGPPDPDTIYTFWTD